MTPRPAPDPLDAIERFIDRYSGAPWMQKAYAEGTLGRFESGQEARDTLALVRDRLRRAAEASARYHRYRGDADFTPRQRQDLWDALADLRADAAAGEHDPAAAVYDGALGEYRRHGCRDEAKRPAAGEEASGA